MYYCCKCSSSQYIDSKYLKKSETQGVNQRKQTKYIFSFCHRVSKIIVSNPWNEIVQREIGRERESIVENEVRQLMIQTLNDPVNTYYKNREGCRKTFSVGFLK